MTKNNPDPTPRDPHPPLPFEAGIGGHGTAKSVGSDRDGFGNPFVALDVDAVTGSVPAQTAANVSKADSDKLRGSRKGKK